jgi:hypothetical protein
MMPHKQGQKEACCGQRIGMLRGSDNKSVRKVKEVKEVGEVGKKVATVTGVAGR